MEAEPTYKTIREVAESLELPQHVLRFWETQFSQVKPVKRRGGRRFYSEKDIETIQRIRALLYTRGYTIKGAKQALNQHFIPSNDFKADIKAENKDENKGNEQPRTTFVAGDSKAQSSSSNTNAEKAALRKLLANLREMEGLLSGD